MNGHYLVMPFKPHGQEEWLDTSDEEDYEEDAGVEDEEDEEDTVEDVPSRASFKDKFLRTQSGSMQNGPCRPIAVPLEQRGMSSTLQPLQEDSTEMNTLDTNTESKRSCCGVYCKGGKSTTRLMTQATSLELCLQRGMAQPRPTRLERSATLLTPISQETTVQPTGLKRNISTECTVLSPKPKTPPVLSLPESGLKSSKDSKDVDIQSV